MSRKRFVATTSSGGLEKSQFWDSKKPMILGYRLPWILAEVQEKVYLKHRSGKAFQLSPEMIDQEMPVDLPDLDQQGQKVVFRLRRASTPKPVTEGSSQPSGDWYLFSSHGNWILGSEKLSPNHVAKAGRRKAFTLSQSGDSFRLKPHDPALVISGVADPAARTFSSQDLSYLEISGGGYRWTFSRQSPATTLPEGLGESDRLYRSVMASLVGVFALAMFIVFQIAPQPKPEEKKAGTFARVKMSRSPERAAPPAPPAPKAKQEPAPSPAKKVVVQPPQQTKPKAKLEPPKPVVPKVDPALVRAQNQAKQLQSSLASLLKMAPKANALAKVDAATAPSVLDAKSSALETAQTEVSPTVTQQNVSVSASGGDRYAQGASGADVRAMGTRGGGMVDIAGAGEQGTQMSEEGLSRREVFEVIQKHMSEIRNCYEKAILRKDNIEGKVLVGFSIAPSGTVASASVKNSTVGDKFLDQCIVERLKHWAFPKPKGGGRVDVMYPFVFKRL